MSIFRETWHALIEYRDVHVNFLFRMFWHFKFVFLVIGTYASMYWSGFLVVTLLNKRRGKMNFSNSPAASMWQVHLSLMEPKQIYPEVRDFLISTYCFVSWSTTTHQRRPVLVVLRTKNGFKILCLCVAHACGTRFCFQVHVSVQNGFHYTIGVPVMSMCFI